MRCDGLGECPEWQRGRTVNPLSYDFVGSSPTSPTILFLQSNFCLRQVVFVRSRRVYAANPNQAITMGYNRHRRLHTTCSRHEKTPALVARGLEEPSMKRRCQADRPIIDDLSGVASRWPQDGKAARALSVDTPVHRRGGREEDARLAAPWGHGNAYLPIGVGRSRRLLGSNAKGRHPDASQRQLRRRGGCSAATL